MGIPRVLHQIWIGGELPAAYQTFALGWRSAHPRFAYKLWGEEDLRALLVRHNEALLPVFDSYPLAVNKADLGRYLVLQAEGGVYLDLDLECLRAIDPLLVGRDLVFAREPPRHEQAEILGPRGLGMIVSNAFMGSVPDHPFWDGLLSRAAAAAEADDVLDATGPFLLSRACLAADDSLTSMILPAEAINPIDRYALAQLTAPERRARAGDAYAIHHWHGSWTRAALLWNARRQVLRHRHEQG